MRATPTQSYTLSLHDALPIYVRDVSRLLQDAFGVVQSLRLGRFRLDHLRVARNRSEEHTSELQSPYDLVCRLLLQKTTASVRNRKFSESAASSSSSRHPPNAP